MKLLLLGGNGQVGWELRRALAPLGRVVALERRGDEAQRADLADADGLARAVRAIEPDVIVNAAAYTAVDEAESDRAAASAVNSAAPGVLAREAATLGALLVHYSTDYVFDGSGERPWSETDDPAPLNVYGATKLDGERAIRGSGCRYLILRTSWVYSSRRHNFLRTLLRLARERETLAIVDDQFGAPTSAELIADVTAHIVRSLSKDSRRDGLYHLAASGETSRHEYACFIVEHARALGWPLRASRERIEPVASATLAGPARRPRNSRLDCRALLGTFDLHLPHWARGVERVLAELRFAGAGEES